MPLEGRRPLFLSSSIREDNAGLMVDLTNPDFRLADDVLIPRGTVHLFRAQLLWLAACHERLHLSFTNHGEDVGVNVLRRQGRVAVVTVR